MPDIGFSNILTVQIAGKPEQRFRLIAAGGRYAWRPHAAEDGPATQPASRPATTRAAGPATRP